MDDLTSGIKALAKREGISLIGIASARGWKVARGRNPTDILPSARSIIVLAMPVPDKVIEEATVGERESVKKAIRKEMERVGSKIMESLTKNGYVGVVPSGNIPSNAKQLRGLIPLKYAAYRAGLGAIGKSSLLITPQYGPRVRLAAIVTNAPLTPDKPLNVDFCGTCMVCEKVCVGKAFREGRHDVEICWRAESEIGEQVPGLPYKLCPAPCLKLCPVGKLKEKYRVS